MSKGHKVEVEGLLADGQRGFRDLKEMMAAIMHRRLLRVLEGLQGKLEGRQSGPW